MEPNSDLNNAQDELWTLKEVCAYTKLSKWTLYDRRTEKRLPIRTYRFGNVLRFRKKDVLAWIETHVVN